MNSVITFDYHCSILVTFSLFLHPAINILCTYCDTTFHESIYEGITKQKKTKDDRYVKQYTTKSFLLYFPLEINKVEYQ